MEQLKFEQKLEQLENLINELENDNVSLDDSISKYTKAMNLIKECDSELKNIEEKIAKIVENDGTMVEFKTSDN